MPYAATWTDLEMIIPSQRKAKPLRITYEWNLRNSTNECIYWTENDLQTQKRSLWLWKGKVVGEGINYEVGINTYTPLHVKQKNDKDLCTAQNYIQYLVITSDVHLKYCQSTMCSWLCVWLFATPWLWKSATSNNYQAPLSKGFSRQVYWSRLPCPAPGDAPDPGMEPGSPALQADALPTESPRKSTMLQFKK